MSGKYQSMSIEDLESAFDAVYDEPGFHDFYEWHKRNIGVPGSKHRAMAELLDCWENGVTISAPDGSGAAHHPGRRGGYVTERRHDPIS
jgi:hypothetical protein